MRVMRMQESAETTMEPINARSMLNAASAAVATTESQPRVERRRRLSQAALAVANEKVRPAYSPTVIAGAVRLIDFALLSLTGIALYLGYVVPLDKFHWSYVAAIFGMSIAAVICFQAADIYQVQVFRGQLRQMTRMISSWSFVFLLFIGIFLPYPASIAWTWMFCLVAFLLCLSLTFFVSYFFRDQIRIDPADPSVIVSSADGLVVSMNQTRAQLPVELGSQLHHRVFIA